MINREEVLEFAREFQLEPNVVEKDYALGWLLAGIGNHPVLRDAWVFKGGTCLKKCFFETYRFSEDLDFTVRDPAHLDVGFLSGTFAEIAEWVYDASGLEMPRETHKFEVFNNPRGKPSAQGRVGYRGPLGRIGDFDSKEEFECAVWLDMQAQKGRIDFWVRNLVRKEGCSFFLQKADGRFYPDFLCQLSGGVILAVEYKGANQWAATEDDRLIGGLWEELSSGRCRFVMTTEKDWSRIDAKL